MSPKLKCHLNWKVTKNKISPKMKYHQNRNVTKTEIGLYIWTFKFNSMSSALIALMESHALPALGCRLSRIKLKNHPRQLATRIIPKSGERGTCAHQPDQAQLTPREPARAGPVNVSNWRPPLRSRAVRWWGWPTILGSYQSWRNHDNCVYSPNL